MNIHKLKKHQEEIPYFMISREVVQSIDNSLALAIWVYLQSKPDDWKVVESDILNQFSVGRTTYLRAMKCLREAKLYSVSRLKNNQNQFIGSTIHIYEVPTSTDDHTYGKPHLRDATHMETHTDIKEEEILTEKESITEKNWLKFYEPFPKKTKKASAYKLFKKMSLKNQKLAIEDNATDRYKYRQQNYKPNPCNYLKEEMWNDERDEVVATSHHQISSMVNTHAEVKELNQDEIRRLANAH